MKKIAFLIIVVMTFSLPLLAQDDNSGSTQGGCCGGDHESMGNMHGSMNHGNELLPLDNEEKPVDLEKLDKNKDGKLFVCEMHKEVIKDEPGDCPKCGMTLKENTIEEVKKNLLKNGSKAK